MYGLRLFLRTQKTQAVLVCLSWGILGASQMQFGTRQNHTAWRPKKKQRQPFRAPRSLLSNSYHPCGWSYSKKNAINNKQSNTLMHEENEARSKERQSKKTSMIEIERSEDTRAPRKQQEREGTKRSDADARENQASANTRMRRKRS